MKDATEYVRVCWIHEQLKRGRLDKAEYFHQFNRSDRTFIRDIDRLRDELCAPLVYDSKKKKYVYTDTSYELPLMFLNEQELFGLIVSTSLLEQYKNTPFYDTIYKIFHRLASHLGTDITYLYRSFYTRPLSLRPFTWEYIEGLIRAIQQKQTVKLHYRSFHSLTHGERLVDPYHVYNYEGEFYLVGYCHKNNEFRDFFIGRITDIEIMDDIFSHREFDVDSYFSDKQWGMMKGGNVENVVFKIRKDREPWLIEEFGAQLRKIDETGDWSVYETEVVINNDFLNWTVGFNKMIVIVKPEKVRVQVRKHIEEIMHEYI